MNIMLIDDNKIDLFVNQKIIERLSTGCDIRAFTSANSAINFLKILEDEGAYPTMFVPDVILLDINMPEMDGFQFLEEFEELNKIDKKSIRIYMLSSSTSPQDVEKIEASNSCIGLIAKPLKIYNVEELLEEFRPYLKRFDAEAEDVSLVGFKQSIEV
ncbi:response regulator [Lacinutrix algicola]|uniref:response regulator n=1 Tax=Lacinutrix algicola TaxID=342954 RepID=UPI000A7E4F19|nr:response regulator [Lacinutrix algicola]